MQIAGACDMGDPAVLDKRVCGRAHHMGFSAIQAQKGLKRPVAQSIITYIYTKMGMCMEERGRRVAGSDRRIFFEEGNAHEKRGFALLLTCALVLAGAAGCGGTAEDANTIKIGGLAPLTGNNSAYGISTNNGIMMAVEEINAAGGILGKQIDYIYYDEKGDATEAVSAYNKLVQSDNVVAVIGDVTSTPSIAVAQESVKDGIPVITATGSAGGITQAGENVFRVCFTDAYQGEVMASYAAQKLNKQKAAILYNASNDYSIGLTESFEKQAAQEGMQVVSKESYNTGDVDFRTQLTKIADSGADVLFLPEYYEEVAQIIPQAKTAGINITLLGADGWDGVIDQIQDKSQLADAYFCCGYSPEMDNEGLQTFIQKYTQTYNEAPKGFSAQGYDAMYLLKAAMEKAGTTDKEAVVQALKDIEFEGITGTIVFDENRNPLKGVVVNTFEDGVVKYVETYEK